MKHTIRTQHGNTFIIDTDSNGNTFIVDTDSTESDMRYTNPLFFKTAHGSRETFTVYKGFLIVRNTVQFTGQSPVRRTVFYVYTENKGLLHINNADDLSNAKKQIDALIKAGASVGTKTTVDSFE